MNRNDIRSCGWFIDTDEVGRDRATDHPLDIRYLQGNLEIDGSFSIPLSRRFHLSQEIRRTGTRAEQLDQKIVCRALLAEEVGIEIRFQLPAKIEQGRCGDCLASFPE